MYLDFIVSHSLSLTCYYFVNRMLTNKTWLNNEEHEIISETLYKNYVLDNGEDFQILSTIRYDPNLTELPPTNINDVQENNFFLISEHYDRLLFSFSFFNKSKCLDISKSSLIDKLKETIQLSNLPLNKSLKVRLLTSLDGTMNIELYPTPEKNLLEGLQLKGDSFKLFVDSEPIMISPFTSFKTTKRNHYSQARTRCLTGEGKEEVIVYNSENVVMEGSITNIAIKYPETGEWITPPLKCGCLCGVMRHFLLEKDLIKESTIYKSDLKEGDTVMIFNAIMGVSMGTITKI